MKWLDDLQAISAASLGRRALYAVLLAVGVTMTAFGSIFISRLGPIPYKIFPDVRPVALMLSGLMLGLYASGGGAHRRGMALSGVVASIIGFHLEEATVHWIGPIPGSITGTPVGLLGTSGSLLALVAVLLMHVEVESHRLAADLRARGATPANASGLAARLSGDGARTIGALALGIAGLSALVLAVVPVFGYNASGGQWTLILGAALLLGLAIAVARLVRRGAAAS